MVPNKAFLPDERSQSHCGGGTGHTLPGLEISEAEVVEVNLGHDHDPIPHQLLP